MFVLGAGGHAKVVISCLLATGLEVAGLLDDDPRKWGTRVLGIPIHGGIREARAKPAGRGILAVGDNRARAQLTAELTQWEWVSVVHPRAFVDPSAILGPGTLVAAGSVVQPDVVLGSHVIVNTGATVDHDCVVGDFVHLAPGSHLGGAVVVEEGALVGLGAVVLPGIRIGAWSVVGAGAVVIRDVPPGATVVGVPARPLPAKENE